MSTKNTKREIILDKAVELLKNNIDGYRYSELIKKLEEIFPKIPSNTIVGSIFKLVDERSKEVFKPSRGLFKYKFSEDKISDIETQKQKKSKQRSYINEGDFYQSFADYIENDLGECTKAIALGGNKLGKKWGTPDVLGVYKASNRDVIQFQPEIISAEVKIDNKDPITAFGQAISYRLFSSKVYLVIPNESPEDLDRIEALCILFGIGLILFDLDKSKPNYNIRVRAQRHIPDYFYANKLAERLYEVSKKMYLHLF